MSLVGVLKCCVRGEIWLRRIYAFFPSILSFIQYKMNQRLSNRSQSKVSVERAIKSLYNKEFTSIRSAARYFETPKSFFIIV